MQEKVTVGGSAMQQAGRNYFTNGGKFSSELRSVTKIVKYLNKQHNSEALTFKDVSQWLIEEGYWQKENGRIRPTEKGKASGMSLQHCCLNGKEFESVYCDKKMQTIISGRFGSFFDNPNENVSYAATELPSIASNSNMSASDKRMAQTWKELADSYYEKKCFKEAAECYRNMVSCVK